MTINTPSGIYCIHTLSMCLDLAKKLQHIFNLTGNEPAEIEIQNLIDRLQNEIDNADAGMSVLARDFQKDSEEIQ